MATTVEQEAPPKKKSKGLMVMLLVAAVAAGAGFMAPRLLTHEAPKKTAPEAESNKPAVILFGDVVVNLGGDDRLSRLMRVKIMLAVDGPHEKSVTEHMNKQRAFLKNWLIGYLSDLSLQDVSRTVGVNRLRREIRDQFNAILWPDGRELVLEVRFDEFVV